MTTAWRFSEVRVAFSYYYIEEQRVDKSLTFIRAISCLLACQNIMMRLFCDMKYTWSNFSIHKLESYLLSHYGLSDITHSSKNFHIKQNFTLYLSIDKRSIKLEANVTMFNGLNWGWTTPVHTYGEKRDKVRDQINLKHVKMLYFLKEKKFLGFDRIF